MKVARDEITELTIRRIERDNVRIGDQVFTGHVALTSEEIIRDWPARPVEDMHPHDLERLVEFEPEVIVVGGGFRPVQPSTELVFAMARRGIGIEFMDTPAAARTFNILLSEGRRPAAILLLET